MTYQETVSEIRQAKIKDSYKGNLQRDTGQPIIAKSQEMLSSSS